MNARMISPIIKAVLFVFITAFPGSAFAVKVGCTENIDCDDFFDCTLDICDTGNGTCSNTPQNVECNDFLGCTTDSCDPENSEDETGCVNAPSNEYCWSTYWQYSWCQGSYCDPEGAPGTSGCTDDMACVENSDCLTNDCSDPEQTGQKTCQPPSCDDGFDCTVDYCDQYGTDECKHEAYDVTCKNSETCNDESCQDAADCVDAECSETLGCIYETNDLNCNDNLFCNGEEFCDFTQDCLDGAAPCTSDGFDCTLDCDEDADNCPYTPDDGECDDLIACTDDVCDTGNSQDATGCVYTPDDGKCDDDGVACTEESCDAVNGCESIPNDGLCSEDGVGCTTARCDEVSDCQQEDNGTCDDDLYCNGLETCDLISDCQPGEDPCDGEVECVTYGCSEGAGQADCTETPDDGQCNDGVSCTEDSCDLVNGCQFDPNDGLCSEDGVSCTTARCDADLDCQQEDNGSCDDGLYCNGLETCDIINDCQPGVDPCDKGVECVTYGCSEGAEAAVCTETPDDDYCDDDDVCNGVEVCNVESGCVIGTPALNCDDGNPCSTDNCDAIDGCSWETLPDLTVCDILPEIPEICFGGVCIVKCTDDSDCDPDGFSCTEDTCNTTTGLCEYPTNDADCNDGLPCNGVETCDPENAPQGSQTGCVEGTPPSCDEDEWSCTTTSCIDPQGCTHTPQDSECTNNDVCDGMETCDPENALPDSDGCVDGTPLDCPDDDNICTDIDCDPVSGCGHVYNSDPCEDDDPCTLDDHCSEGVCGGTAKDCSSDNQCYSENYCHPTTGNCIHINKPNGSECDDELFCTILDSCTDSVCGGLTRDCSDGVYCTSDSCNEEINECVSDPVDSACIDGNECTDEVCDPDVCNTTQGCNPANGCVYTDNTVSCNDYDNCTDNDTCSEGGCAGTPKDCSDYDIICHEGTCNPATGNCYSDPIDNGLPCDDGKYCTVGDTCNSGVCDGADRDCGDQADCTEDSCDDIENTCVNAPNHSICQNVDYCDGEEICDPDDPLANASTGCAPGATVDCNDSIDCTEDYCDETINKCVNMPDNGACDDGLYCTGTEICQYGYGCAVVPLSVPTCAEEPDDVPCTEDICIEVEDGFTCEHEPFDTECDDELWCNGLETCDPVDGCIDGEPPDCDDLVSCTADECDEEADECSNEEDDGLCPDMGFCRDLIGCDPVEDCQYSNKEDGIECDIDPEKYETCRGGQCVPGCTENTDCDDGLDCSLDLCTAGWCSHDPDPTYDCDNGVFCDGDEICDPAHPDRDVNGCAPGPARDCSDEWECTQDTCNEGADNCEHNPVNGWCLDTSFCNGEEFCDPAHDDKDARGCVAGDSVVCDEGAACTDGACNESTHDCDYTPNDEKCQDGTVCNGIESCVPGSLDADENGCITGEALVCDDEVACTTNSCDPATGCFYTPEDTACDDEIDCTADSCDKTLGCIFTPNDAECNDGIPCTADSCSAETGCLHDPDDGACDDGVGCTVDECIEGSGCENTPDDGACNDGVGCTVDVCDLENDCGNTPDDNACDDSIPCTADSCDAELDCQHDPDDGACSDGVDCTIDVCDTVNGCGSTPDENACDDGVGCTADSCDLVNGCANAPEDSACDDEVSCTADTCDPDNDCQHAPEDSACDDQVDCTADSCDPVDDCRNVPDDAECNDEVDCTNDECHPALGCRNTPDNDLCDDGVDCTIDACDAVEGCRFFPNAVLCDDGITCTRDVCREDLGCESVADDTLCDDGEFCNGDEFCSAEEDCYNIPRDCSDGVDCTDDSCDEGTLSCLHDTNDLHCDDENPCTEPDTCTLTGCEYSNLDDDTPCDLDILLEETCQDGFCVADCLNAEDCDDAAECTTDSCSESGHCFFEPDHDFCNIGRNFCDPVMECVPFAGCVEGEPPDCGDGVECTIDACDPVLEECSNEASDSLCDDGNPCTINTCDSTNGCMEETVPDGEACGEGLECRGGFCLPVAGDGDLDDDEADREDIEIENIDFDPEPEDEADETDEMERDADGDADIDEEADIDEASEIDGSEEDFEFIWDFDADWDFNMEDDTKPRPRSGGSGGSGDDCRQGGSPAHGIWAFLGLMLLAALRRRFRAGD